MTYHTNSTASATTQFASTPFPSLPLPLAVQASEWLAKYLPSKISLRLPSNAHLERSEPETNYVIGSTHNSDADALTLTLAQQFAGDGGHVIWIGTTRDLQRMSEQLMFKIAGLELPAEGTKVQLGVLEYLDLMDARAEMMNMWIDFCNVEDCGDTALEQEFVASMSSFKPTLIVVDASIFDEAALNPFDALVRQTYGLHMVNELRGTNPASSVLWPSSAPTDAFAT
jgi:hypothetical protein